MKSDQRDNKLFRYKFSNYCFFQSPIHADLQQNYLYNINNYCNLYNLINVIYQLLIFEITSEYTNINNNKVIIS